MERKSESFGIAMSNVPTINLRNEFTYWWAHLRAPKFVAALQENDRPIETRYLKWYGARAAFLTLVVQRSIAGAESYVGGLLFDVLARAGRLDESNADALRVFKGVKGCSMADKLYNGLPRLFHEQLTLKFYDAALNDRNEQFYREVRNPLMHGLEFARNDIESAKICLEHLALLYGWMDSQNPPSRMFGEFGGKPYHVFAPPDPRIYGADEPPGALS